MGPPRSPKNLAFLPAKTVLGPPPNRPQEADNKRSDAGRSHRRFPPKADMCGATGDVRYGPIADIDRELARFDHPVGHIIT